MVAVIAVLGAGPHGRELADVAAALRLPVVFFDDDPDMVSEGPVSLLTTHRSWVAGAAWPAVRRKILEQCSGFEEWAATLVHPAATTGASTYLSQGVVVAAGARLGPNVSVCPHTHVAMNATISRDCQIGGCVTICPGAQIAGGVVVGDDVFVGIGAVVSHELVIGERALIGAGAVVVEDVAPGATVVGNPARPLR